MGSPERPDTRAVGAAGARGALLLAAALILGILILQQFDDGGVPFSQQVTSDDTTATTRRQTSVSVIPPTTGRPLRGNGEVKVLAANGTGTPGLAGKTSDFMRNLGYDVLQPTDATRVIETTLVEYNPEFEPEARALAQLMLLPASSVRPMEDNPPVGDRRSADIIVIIGPDLRLPSESTGPTTSTTVRR